MTESAWQTLFHPFEAGWLDMPAAGERWLFVGAVPGFRLPDGFAAGLTIVQGFRPWFNALAAAGFEVVPQPGEARGPFDGALVMLGRHRGENEMHLRDAALAVKPDGPVIAAGTKNDGAASFAKRLAQILPGVEHAAKHHGTVLWFARPDDEACVHGLPKPETAPLVEGRFRTAPGMFSHDRVDVGSTLLAGHLPAGLKGDIADFGAGWGYLSAMIAEKCPGVTAIGLYEADFASLEAAKVNLAKLAVQPRFFWCDLAGETVAERYDAIVMNPPFHAGRKADPELGKAMIARAAQALKPHGRLLMVANRQLPYEQALSSAFKRHRLVAEAHGFKVLEAER